MKVLSNCPACGSTSFAKVHSGRTTQNPADPKLWDLARCTECDHGFLNPQPDWDDLAPYYNANYAPYESAHGLNDELKKTIDQAAAAGTYRDIAIRPGLRVLDVGAGGGSFLEVIRALGADAHGVEPSSIGTKVARDKGLDIFEGTLESFVEAGAQKHPYDTITFSHVVEHLPDPVRTLSLAATLLAPGGLINVAVPNGGCRSARKLGWRWHSSDLPVHLQHFTPNSMKITAERAGLSVRQIRTYSWPNAVRQSIISEWRNLWMIPGRVGHAVVSMPMATRRAVRMDRENTGEAIIADFGLAAQHA